MSRKDKSAAARKGWETRRRNAEEAERILQEEVRALGERIELLNEMIVYSGLMRLAGAEIKPLDFNRFSRLKRAWRALSVVDLA